MLRRDPRAVASAVPATKKSMVEDDDVPRPVKKSRKPSSSCATFCGCVLCLSILMAIAAIILSSITLSRSSSSSSSSVSVNRGSSAHVRHHGAAAVSSLINDDDGDDGTDTTESSVSGTEQSSLSSEAESVTVSDIESVTVSDIDSVTDSETESATDSETSSSYVRPPTPKPTPPPTPKPTPPPTAPPTAPPTLPPTGSVAFSGTQGTFRAGRNNGGGLSDVTILFLCTVQQDDDSCLSIFTYDNVLDSQVVLPAGTSVNTVSGAVGGGDSGQTEAFLPGLHFGAASFSWDCASASEITWTVRSGAGQSIAVASVATSCPTISQLL